jgi:TRAP-type C4-dicarboxylate transport system permease small subunit
MNTMHTVTFPHPSPRRIVVFLDNVLARCVEIPAALLVLAEIVVLFAGVTSRYVLHTPLVWSDELASMLFVWLAMLGAVIALRRGEHMRMTALVGKTSPQVRAFFDVVAIAAPLAFLLLIVSPAIDFAQDQGMITTPALGISAKACWGSAWPRSRRPSACACSSRRTRAAKGSGRFTRRGTRCWQAAMSSRYTAR